MLMKYIILLLCLLAAAKANLFFPYSHYSIDWELIILAEKDDWKDETKTISNFFNANGNKGTININKFYFVDEESEKRLHISLADGNIKTFNKSLQLSFAVEKIQYPFNEHIVYHKKPKRTFKYLLHLHSEDTRHFGESVQ